MGLRMQRIMVCDGGGDAFVPRVTSESTETPLNASRCSPLQAGSRALHRPTQTQTQTQTPEATEKLIKQAVDQSVSHRQQAAGHEHGRGTVGWHALGTTA